MEKKMFSVLVFALLASGLASAVMVDDFESYSTGPVVSPWTEAQRGGYAKAAAIKQDGEGGNKYLAIQPSPAVTPNLTFDPTNAIYRPITAIANADTATTLFTRFRAETATVNASFGLSKVVTPIGYQTGSFTELSNQMRVSVQSSVLCFDFYNNTAWATAAQRTAITVGQWYNVWAVIHQNTDTFDLYLTTGNNGADIAGNRLFALSGIGFRGKAPTEDLVTFLAMTQGNRALANANPLDLDDIAITSGEVLTIPEPASMLLLGLGGLVMSLRRKR
jgi:hypothetical protein